MAFTHAVLNEYAGGRWEGRIVSGPAAAEVERWLARMEARPSLPPGASGKPLAWLYLGAESGGTLRPGRSVGLQTDVLRALDRPLTPEDLQALREIFARSGQPFSGAIGESAG